MNDQPRYSVLNAEAMAKLIIDSGSLRRIVELPDFAQLMVTFENTPRDFQLAYKVERDGKPVYQKLSLERGEVLLINVAMQDALLPAPENCAFKMFYHHVRPQYKEEKVNEG